jgi:hypothetical protein
MRPPAQSQSALRFPLNHILGTEANVRVLRVLSQLASPISAPELAKRSQLQRSSVHRATKFLEELGIVAYVGTAAHSQIALREESPVAKPIRQIFRAEREHYEGLLNSLQKLAESIHPPPMAVWLDGSVSAGTDRPGEHVVITVVDHAKKVDGTVDLLRKQSERIQKRYDVQIDVRGRTSADLDALNVDESDKLLSAVPLLGVPPGGLLPRYRKLWKARNIRVHSDHDNRALAYGSALAEAITKDPSLVDDARRYIGRRWKNASARERKELAEWKRILGSASPAQLRKILTDPGERATRLRQTIPFIGLFSAEIPDKP